MLAPYRGKSVCKASAASLSYAGRGRCPLLSLLRFQRDMDVGTFVTQGAAELSLRASSALPWARRKPAFVGFGWAFSPLLRTLGFNAGFALALHKLCITLAAGFACARMAESHSSTDIGG